MCDANATERWLALPSYLGRSPIIATAEYSWSVLSGATHQRGYDVGLTEAELRAHVVAAHEFRKLVGEKLQAGLQMPAP